MSAGDVVRVFLSRRFRDFSSNGNVTVNVGELAKALRAVLGATSSDDASGVGFELVDLLDRSSTFDSAQERSMEGVESCDLLIVLLGETFSEIVSAEVELAMELGMGVLAYRLPAVDPLTGDALVVEEAQHEFLLSLEGLDRSVIGQLPSSVFYESDQFDQFPEARRIRDDLLRAVDASPVQSDSADRSRARQPAAPLPWGLISEGTGRAAAVRPGDGVLECLPLDRSGALEERGARVLVHRADVDPHTRGAAVASGEIVHGGSDVLVFHRPGPTGYLSTEIAMEAPGEVVGAWAQVQQVVVAWATPSGTELVRLARASGTRLATEWIAGAPLERVGALARGWIGLTGEGGLVVGPAVPAGVRRLGTEVAGRWVDLDVAQELGGQVVLGLVHTADADPGPRLELIAASIGVGAVPDVRSVPLDRAAERVFAGLVIDAGPNRASAHLYGPEGAWVAEPFSSQGDVGSTAATWR